MQAIKTFESSPKKLRYNSTNIICNPNTLIKEFAILSIFNLGKTDDKKITANEPIRALI